MELDTGSAVSVISHVDYRKYFPTLPLDSTSVTLKTYSGERIIPEGVMHVKVQYNNQSVNLDLYVVRKGGPPLFGREGLHHFQLNWKEIKSLKISQETESSNSKIVKVAEEYEKSNPKLHKLLVKSMQRSVSKWHWMFNTKESDIIYKATINTNIHQSETDSVYNASEGRKGT
jgi:mevalonate kinase